MLLITYKNILRFILFCGLCFCLSCNQSSIAVSNSTLPSQPTPPIVALNESKPEENVKYYSPPDTCQKIKGNDARALCELIVKDQDLTDQALTYEFVYASRPIDLNGDGRNEVIAWIPTQDLGGTSGYPIIIFSETPNGYQKLWDIDQAWTPILVLNSKNHGWRDVAFQFGGGGEDWHYVILRHNGKSYDVHKTQKKQPKGELLIDKDWNQSICGPILSQ